MTRLLLRHALLLDPESDGAEPGELLIEDGRIRARLRPGAGPEDAEAVDLEGRGLAPGFLDLHHHGRAVFSEPADCPGVLRQEAASLVRQGTTAFLPTTVAWPRAELRGRLDGFLRGLEKVSPEGAAALGLHLEGPWINPTAAGAQPRGGIQPYDAAAGGALLDRAEGRIRMVTLAPEVEGAALLQEQLVRRGIVTALGHSLADDACVRESVTRGARHVTHLFNAMGPLHHRTLGMAGSALTDDRLTADLICDGVHVHPAVVRLAARAKGDGLVLITDRVDPGPEGSGFGSGAVHDDGAALRLPDGTLAGSSLTLDRALRNARDFGVPALEALAACTVRPARLLGVEGERGTLRPGARADLVVLDAGWQVRQTWIAGRRVHEAAASGPAR